MKNQFQLELLDEMHRIKSVEHHDSRMLARASGENWKLLTSGNSYRINDTREYSIKPLRKCCVVTTRYKGRVIKYQYGESGCAALFRQRVIENPTKRQLMTALSAQAILHRATQERRQNG